MAHKKPNKETPLMRQFNQIKTKYPDALLLFRVGDFYETFGEDAVKTSKILGIVLTHRNNGSDRTELAGFPHHSLQTYLPKLVKAGMRVAVCDQLEDPKLTKTIVKRGVTELVTPGVVLNDQILETKTNNYLCALYQKKTSVGVAFLDITTGDFFVDENSIQTTEKLLHNFSPKEILIPKKQKQWYDAHLNYKTHLFYLDDWIVQYDYAYEKLLRQFGSNSLKGFGIQNFKLGIISAGSIFHYLNETKHQQLKHISKIRLIDQQDYVYLDHFTLRNLEIFHSINGKEATLIETIDQTSTPMGGRTLKNWINFPLKSLERIDARLNTVKALKQDIALLEHWRQHLKQINDLERIASKIATGKVSPRELIQVGYTLKTVIQIKTIASNHQSKFVKTLIEGIPSLDNLIDVIYATIDKDAPHQLNKGHVIATGHNPHLDEWRDLVFNTKKELDRVLEKETVRTKIPSLKIDKNHVFGYYLEVRNTHKDKVPEDWVRKQTLASAERYITQELKEFEQKILHAESSILELEQSLFQEFIQTLVEQLELLKKTAKSIGQIDCFCAFAHLAISNNYAKPVINESLSIDIKGGRHPVIEKHLNPDETYISNDVYLNSESQQILIITGPNMSGKSAILRQTALITLMAQIGCFVPVSSATIGIVDKIFTRVGAGDNLSGGESTFMVEMNETASILNNFSERSLILLDEIGRGTSTYDGISIAWSITEYLHRHPYSPKTLFATHYHELNEMQKTHKKIKNFSVAVKEIKDKVLFIRTLKEGGSRHSFGIHVAKMAGMPQDVIENAHHILKKLEHTHSINLHEQKTKVEMGHPQTLKPEQTDDKNIVLLDEIKQSIQTLDINTLSPIEALILISQLQKKIKE